MAGKKTDNEKYWMKAKSTLVYCVTLLLIRKEILLLLSVVDEIILQRSSSYVLCMIFW